MTREELPEVLTAEHIQKFLKIGRRKTYELLNNPPFHVVKVGRLIKVSKESFLKWFDGEYNFEIVERDKKNEVTKFKVNGRVYVRQIS